MRPLALLLCLGTGMALISPVVGAEKDDAAAKEQAALNGRWVLVSIEGAGVKLTAEQLKGDGRGFVFRDGKAESFVGTQTRASGTYSVDPAKSPKPMDITLGPEGVKPEQSVLAIYRLEDDRLTLCNRKPGGERPAEFKADETTMIAVFEREKP